MSTGLAFAVSSPSLFAATLPGELAVLTNPELNLLPTSEITKTFNCFAQALNIRAVAKFATKGDAIRRTLEIQETYMSKKNTQKPAAKAEKPIGVEVKGPDAPKAAKAPAAVPAASKPAPAAAKGNEPLDPNNPPRMGVAAPAPKAAKLPTAEELAAADAKATKKAEAAAKKEAKAKEAETKKAEREARKAAKAAGEKVAPGASGRKSKFSGLTFHTVRPTNTRRPGSHGFTALQIVFDNPGISYEGYMQKGGGLNHLDWDLTHGNLIAKNPDGSAANPYADAPAPAAKAEEKPAPAAPAPEETPARESEAEPIAA